jgi:hypothetical protein
MLLLLVFHCLNFLYSANAYCNAMRHAGYGPRTSTDFPPVIHTPLILR